MPTMTASEPKMDPTADIVKTLEASLGPFIKPREEALHIRRILALHLNECLHNEPGNDLSPLALPAENTSSIISSASVIQNARGLQKEYLKALGENIKARDDHVAVKKSLARVAAPAPALSQDRPDRIEEHLARARMRQKCDKLQAVERYLDLLARRPPASQDFMTPDNIFAGSRALPLVPKEVVDSVALGRSREKTDLKDLISRLEKSVLNAKMVRKREEQLLEECRARSSSALGAGTDASAGPKLYALNAVRNELIGWIEGELSRTSEDGQDASQTPGDGQNQVQRKTALHDELPAIAEKYNRYLAARKALLQDVAQPPQPPVAQLSLKTENPDPPAAAPMPGTYLLTPYIATLLSLAHEQRGLILQKSHLNVALSKQLKETSQALDRLADESQLLPSHPLPGSSSRRHQTNLKFGDSLAAAESLDATSRVRPWVFAADSAKIASLEAVAERIEEGQAAIEKSVRALGEIDRLLGRTVAVEQEGDAGVDKPEQDIWLAEAQERAGRAEQRRPMEMGRVKPKTPADVWSVLNGNLGLMNSEDGLT